jgi:hypothetical protein
MREQSSDLIEVARAIRVYLNDLVDQPAQIDARLVDLLQRSQHGENVDEELGLLLGEDYLVDWVATFLEHGMPPDVVVDSERGIEPLPGRGAPVRTDRFVCPVDGNFVFYRRHVGQRVPPCPDDGATLVVEP